MFTSYCTVCQEGPTLFPFWHSALRGGGKYCHLVPALSQPAENVYSDGLKTEEEMGI